MLNIRPRSSTSNFEDDVTDIFENNVTDKCVNKLHSHIKS